MPEWYVCQTEREHVAAEWLRRGQFETYLPRTLIRQERAFGGRPRIVERVAMLFPSYILIAACEHWQAIRRTIGVVDLLYTSGHPAKLAEAVVEGIRRQERDGLVRLAKPPRWKRGNRCRITAGPFADHLGIYQGMRGADRVLILLALCGGARVEISRRAIIRA